MPQPRASSSRENPYMMADLTISHYIKLCVISSTKRGCGCVVCHFSARPRRRLLAWWADTTGRRRRVFALPLPAPPPSKSARIPLLQCPQASTSRAQNNHQNTRLPLLAGLISKSTRLLDALDAADRHHGSRLRRCQPDYAP